MTMLTILAASSILTTLAINLIVGWDLKAAGACPGTAAFCEGVYWRAVSDYLPLWAFFSQILIVLALASERAWIRIQ